MRKIFFASLLLALFLAGCINPFGKKEYVCESGKFVSDPFFCFEKNGKVTSVTNLTSEVEHGHSEISADLGRIRHEWN